MAVTAYKFCGTCVNDTTIGTLAWVREQSAGGGVLVGTEVSSDNNVRAANSAAGGNVNATSNYLKCTNFGFTNSDVPVGSTINGFEVRVRRHRISTPAVNANTALFVKGGTIGGNDIDTNVDWATTETAYTLGSSGELGGLSWTQSDVVASNFGIALSYTHGNIRIAPTENYLVDSVEIRVYYSAAGTGITVSANVATGMVQTLAPTVSAMGNVAPAAQAVTVATLAPTVSAMGNVAADLSSVTAVTLSPTVAGSAIVQGDLSSVTVTTPEPTIIAISAMTVLADVATGLVQTLDPTISGDANIDLETLKHPETEEILGLSLVNVEAINPTVRGTGNVTPDPQAVLVNTLGPDISGEANVEANLSSVSVTTPEPLVSAPVTISADASSVSGFTLEPLVSGDAVVAIENGDLTEVIVQQPAATVLADANVEAGLSEVTALTLAPTVIGEANIEADLSSITVATLDPTVILTGAATAFADVASGMVVTLEPTVIGEANIDADLSSVTGQTLAPTVEGDANVTASLSSVLGETLSPDISGDAIVEAGVSSVTATTPEPTVSTAGNTTIAADVSSVAGSTLGPDVSGEANVPADVSSVSGNTPEATIAADANVEAGVSSVTGTTNNPDISGEANVGADVSNVTVTTPEPTVLSGVVIQASVQSVSAQTQAPDVSGDATITGFGPEAVSASTLGPNVSGEGNVEAALSSVLVETPTPTILASGGITIAADVSTVLVETLTPSAIGDELSASDFSTTASGFVPSTIDWIPRWMIPHYDEDSYMRKWYTSSFVVYKQEMLDLLLGEIVPSFYGKTTQPRVAYSAKYAYDNHHVPQISVSINNMPAENVTPTTSVKATSIGGLIYNRTEYVWAPYKNNMVFGNLGRVRFLVTALSGQIDITDLLTQYPAVEDSEFILENLNGDQLHLVQNSAHFRDNIIYVGKNGYYYIKWVSQAVHDELIAGSNYILINEHPVNVVPFYLKNVWDEYANHRNLVRQFGESNLSLKKKCQQASILRKAEETISIALGRGQLYLWNTTNQLNFSSSGVVSLDVFNTLQTAYIAESDVAKDSDGNYRLLYEPSDYVQLFHNSMPVDPESFTVSGAVIIPGTIRLQYAEPGSIKANYATELYSVTKDSDDYVSTLTRSACGMESLIVGFTRDVRVTNVTKKIKEWRWNEEKGVLAGLAEFS